MTKRIPPGQTSLFEVIEVEAARERPKEDCPHPKWLDTITIWPGETFERMTSTCAACGEVRGRYYKRKNV